MDEKRGENKEDATDGWMDGWMDRKVKNQKGKSFNDSLRRRLVWFVHTNERKKRNAPRPPKYKIDLSGPFHL